MGTPEGEDLTGILNRASRGDDSAVNRLMPLVYDQLRALAESYLRQERPDHTLQATALVHEAYVRLVRQEEVEWQSRAHFFAVAAQAIRRILVDHARGRQRAKRGGDRQRVRLEEDIALAKGRDLDLLALDEAMEKLATLHERQARIVELRFFGGLSLKDVAKFLGISPRTVDGDWSMARAWLKRELGRGAISS
jgi:RNA polymerase sigma factor (TIGR02999 family)